MKRRLLNLFTLFSLVLCLGGAVAWERSYSIEEQFEWAVPVEASGPYAHLADDYAGGSIGYARGAFHIEIGTRTLRKGDGLPPWWVNSEPATAVRCRNVAGELDPTLR